MPFSEIGHLTKENMPQSSTSQWRVLKVGFYVPIVVVKENRVVDVRVRLWTGPHYLIFVG